jgi:hypothetical protein
MCLSAPSDQIGRKENAQHQMVSHSQPSCCRPSVYMAGLTTGRQKPMSVNTPIVSK